MIVFSHFFKISKSMVWGRNAAMNSLHKYLYSGMYNLLKWMLACSKYALIVVWKLGKYL